MKGERGRGRCRPALLLSRLHLAVRGVGRSPAALRLFLLRDWVRFKSDSHPHMPRGEREEWLVCEHPTHGGTPGSTCAGWR